MEWQKAVVPGCDQNGIPVLSVIAKLTYDICQGKVSVSDNQLPLVEADRYCDPSMMLHSEIAEETDLVAFKPSTDVVVAAKACAPAGKCACCFECIVEAGPLHKTVKVYGKRKVFVGAFGRLGFRAPLPFSEMELGYREAYGGFARDKYGVMHVYPPNPIGKGFCFRGASIEPESIEIPRIEDPLSPVTPGTLMISGPQKWNSAPGAVSLGWTRRDFYPRYTYAGLSVLKIDKTDRVDQKGIFVADPRFFQGASEGLWGKELAGDEHVRLTNLNSQYSVFEFSLPGQVPVMTLDVGEGRKELWPKLQTVIIDMKEMHLSMVWRGAMEYGGINEMKKFRKVEAIVQ